MVTSMSSGLTPGRADLGDHRPGVVYRSSAWSSPPVAAIADPHRPEDHRSSKSRSITSRNERVRIHAERCRTPNERHPTTSSLKSDIGGTKFDTASFADSSKDPVSAVSPPSRREPSGSECAESRTELPRGSGAPRFGPFGTSDRAQWPVQHGGRSDQGSWVPDTVQEVTTDERTACSHRSYQRPVLGWLAARASSTRSIEHDRAFTAPAPRPYAEGVDPRTFAAVVVVASPRWTQRHHRPRRHGPPRPAHKPGTSSATATFDKLTEPQLTALAPGCEVGADPGRRHTVRADDTTRTLRRVGTTWRSRLPCRQPPPQRVVWSERAGSTPATSSTPTGGGRRRKDPALARS